MRERKTIIMTYARQQPQHNITTIPITLYLSETHQQLSTELRHKLVIGRTSTPDKDNTPHLDLSGLQGYEKGVSRRHLMLVYNAESDVVFAFDLKSQNGTILNGQAMSTHTGYEISHGDELKLGSLLIRFYRAAQVPFEHVDTIEIDATDERVGKVVAEDIPSQTRVLKLPSPKPDIRSTLQAKVVKDPTNDDD